MKRRAIYLMSKEELLSLPTKGLLARLKKLLQCEASVEMSDQNAKSSTSADQIQFKNTSQWETAYEEVKAELAKRDHVPTGKESQAMRLDKSKLQKTIDRKIKKQM